MPSNHWRRGSIAALVLAGFLSAQNPTIYPPGFFPQPLPPAPQPPPAQTTPAKPAPAPAQAQPAPAQPAAPGQPAPTVYGGITLNNASLTEVIDMLARQLHINYVLDPRVKGGVILNTYGETKNMDTRSLLEAILRINGFGMVQQGSLYRIVPLNEISHLPLPPERISNPQDIPEDDRTMLNLVFLKYVTADELVKVLTPFLGENAQMYSYAPANLLLILDSRRNMRRTMELISLFDNDTLANQRVHLFETKNGRPSDLVKDLDTIVKSISLNEKSSPIKFLAIDRINTIIGIASNPGAFAEVEKWLKKLDIPVKLTAGATENYVYRVKYGNAVMLAMGIMMLYGGGGGYGMGYPGMGMGMGMGMPGMGMGMPGMGGMSPYGMAGGGMGATGYPGMAAGGMSPYGAAGANPYAMMSGMYGGYGGGYGAPGMGASPFATPQTIAQPNTATTTSGVVTATGAPNDQTGSYLGYQQPGAYNPRMPRVVPNPFNNTLMIQARPEDYEQIVNLLRQMDIAPRQVLIDAKIYEIDLSNSLGTSVAANFQNLGTGSSTSHNLIGSLAGNAVNLSDGFLIGRTKELLAAIQVLEGETKAKIIQAPSIIATDSIPATITVGTSVPVLTAQAVTGAQSGGTSLFANSVSNVSTGVTLNVTAQVNPSGIVTMIINQNISAPQANTSSSIQSPAFQQRSLQTQVTVQDGDTIALGGIIIEQDSFSTSGIPYLNHLPGIGALFGSRNYSKARSELIIFITPRVIYDTNQIREASDELKDKVKHLLRDVKEE